MTIVGELLEAILKSSARLVTAEEEMHVSAVRGARLGWDASTGRLRRAGRTRCTARRFVVWFGWDASARFGRDARLGWDACTRPQFGRDAWIDYTRAKLYGGLGHVAEF